MACISFYPVDIYIPARAHKVKAFWNFFIYFFYHDFAKIYDPSEILRNYTSAAVAHGVTDITSWPTAVGAASSGPVGLTATGHDIKSLTPWDTTLGAYRQAAAWLPGNAAGHGGMYELTAVGCGGSFFFNFNF
jgi:hypothetical protein